MFDNLISKFIHENAPNCVVFRSNIETVTKNFLSEINTAASSNKEPNFERNFTDLYSDKQKNIFDSHDISKEDKGISDSLEVNALTYLATAIAKNYGSHSSEVSTAFRKIEAASTKLLYLLKTLSIEDSLLVAGAFTLSDMSDLNNHFHSGELDKDKAQSHLDTMFLKRFADLEKELKFCSELSKHFQKTFLGGWLQFGMSGPKEHSALSSWIDGLAGIWTHDLDRSISYSMDDNSGREQFLRFAEACMEPLHPDMLETDTIRNTFEKLRQNGKLDYLSEISPKLV